MLSRRKDGDGRSRAVFLEKIDVDIRSRMMRIAVTVCLLWRIDLSPAVAQNCVGDCSGDGSVTVDEIVTIANIALGTSGVNVCPAGDASGDGRVTVDEILQAVNDALDGCPPSSECTTVTVTVRLDLEAGVFPAGIITEVDYPPHLVSIPGSQNDVEVVARVTNVSGVSGLFAVFDQDTDEDEIDDRLRTSAVTFEAYGPGDFEQIRFDCEPGVPMPLPEVFVCSVPELSDELGHPLDPALAGCSVRVTIP